MILIGSTSARAPSIAYQILISLYAYNVVIMIGFFVAAGLLYVRYFGDHEDGKWTARSGFKPWGGPLAAWVYAALCAFLLVAQWVPPKKGSPFLTEVKWFVVPTVGIGFLVLGFAYYIALVYLVPKWFKKDKVLVTDREAVIVRENGEYVQFLEIVEAAWEAQGERYGDGERRRRRGGWRGKTDADHEEAYWDTQRFSVMAK